MVNTEKINLLEKIGTVCSGGGYHTVVCDAFIYILYIIEYLGINLCTGILDSPKHVDS